MEASRIPTRLLLSKRRMDLAVKWRLFKHLSDGDDPEAERVYLWHIERRSGHRMAAGVATDQWKLSLEHYLGAARELHSSMRANGYDARYPIPIDPHGELLDGAHRVACALALMVPYVAVELRPDYAWAPAWDYNWFIREGMSHADMYKMLDDWRLMWLFDLRKNKK